MSDFFETLVLRGNGNFRSCHLQMMVKGLLFGDTGQRNWGLPGIPLEEAIPSTYLNKSNGLSHESYPTSMGIWVPPKHNHINPIACDEPRMREREREKKEFGARNRP